MKNIIKIGGFIIFIFLGFISSVKAWDYIVEGNVKDITSYHIGAGLENNQYHVTTSKCAYCLSPNKPHGWAYNIATKVNPKSSLYELALTLAYEKFVKDGKISANSQSGGVISATFRLISDYYAKLDHSGSSYGSDLTIPYRVSGAAVAHPSYWTGADGQYCVNTFIEIVNLVQNTEGNTARKKYNNLKKNNKVYNPNFRVVANTTSSSDVQVGKTTRVDVTFRVRSDYTDVNWDSFTCTGCRRIISREKVNEHAAKFTVRVDKGVTLFQLHTNYKTVRNGEGRMEIITALPDPYANQKMIMVDAGEQTFTYDLDVTIDGTPPPPPPPPPPTPCSYTDNDDGTRTYYGSDGNETTQSIYQAWCVHKCSFKGDGIYYCSNEDDPDENGPDCSYEEYITDCTYCGQNKQRCTDNPTTPDCLRYWDECPKCTPSVSMPSSCNDFNVESNLKGTVSDINETKTSCNYSVKPVKGCVIGGTDAAGNSYRVDTKLGSNYRCQVYCYEKYTFDVPTAKHSKSGGYFNLSMNVTGTRSCYLGPYTSSYSYGGLSGGQNDLKIESFIHIINNYESQIEDLYSRIEELDMEEVLTPDPHKPPGYYDAETEYKQKQLEEYRRKKEQNLEKMNRILDLIKRMEMDIAEYQKCSTIADMWTNDMKFEPQIQYEYQDYQNKYNTGTFKKVGETAEIKKNTFCYGKTNNQYECLMNGGDLEANNEYWMKLLAKNSNQGNRRVNIYKLGKHNVSVNNVIGSFEFNKYPNYKLETTDDVPRDDSGYYANVIYPSCEITNFRKDTDLLENPYNEEDDQKRYDKWEKDHPIVNTKLVCNRRKTKVNLAIGVEKTVTKTATYIPGQSFSTYHQYGTIVNGEPCAGTNRNYCLWTRLPDTALPVELKTGKGAFQFKLKFNNIGQLGNSLGRLVGSPNSVLNNYNNLSYADRCSVNINPNNGPSGNFETLSQDVGYVCSYINNCDSCGSSCAGGSCNLIPNCDGPNCGVACRTCIYDGTTTRYKYRTISLNNIFPNSCSKGSSNCRNEGYNWNYTGSANRAVNQKAAKTVKEIEDQGEAVYDNAEYSYTLSPTQMGAIRQYNRTVGTYANTTLPNGENALQCDIETYGGIEYSVRCKSQFLRSNEGLYFKTNKRNDTFTLWTETDNCRNGSCLSISNAIGPSWK